MVMSTQQDLLNSNRIKKLENQLRWIADKDFSSGIIKTIKWYLKRDIK